jgi:hypothetical protein
MSLHDSLASDESPVNDLGEEPDGVGVAQIADT